MCSRKTPYIQPSKRHLRLGFPLGEAPRLCRGDEGSRRAKTNSVAKTTFSPAPRPLISRGRPYTPAPASPAGKPLAAASREGENEFSPASPRPKNHLPLSLRSRPTDGCGNPSLSQTKRAHDRPLPPAQRTTLRCHCEAVLRTSRVGPIHMDLGSFPFVKSFEGYGGLFQKSPIKKPNSVPPKRPSPLPGGAPPLRNQAQSFIQRTICRFAAKRVGRPATALKRRVRNGGENEKPDPPKKSKNRTEDKPSVR